MAEIVCVPPALTEPSEQGNPPEQGAVADTNVSPAGTESLNTTLAAVDGPLLLTTIVKVRFVPAVKIGATLLVTETSALEPTVMARFCVLEFPCESVTLAVKANVPSVVGVPLMRPEEESVSPGGSAPVVSPKVYGAMPPDAVRVAE